jgi:hypothetical protein
LTGISNISTVEWPIYTEQSCTLSKLEYNYKNWDMVVYTIHTNYSYMRVYTPEMQLTVGPVGQNFRGSGKWRLCVRPNVRQTFLLLGAVKNKISVGPGYLLDP